MSLLVIIPVCTDDEELCYQNQALAHQFGGKHPFACLLVTAQDRPLANAEKLLALLDKTYTGVSRYMIPDRGAKRPWPQPQNKMFIRTCQYMVNELKGMYDSFFYMESDVTPLRSNWLQDLYGSHTYSGKPHTGAVVGMPWDNNLYVHLNGAAIYKSNLLYLSPSIVTCVETPWDVFVRDFVFPEANDVSKTLFHHSFRSRNYSGTLGALSYDLEFTKATRHPKTKEITREEFVERRTTSLAGFCVLHGCKDDSLFKILNVKIDTQKTSAFMNLEDAPAQFAEAVGSEMTPTEPISRIDDILQHPYVKAKHEALAPDKVKKRRARRKRPQDVAAN